MDRLELGTLQVIRRLRKGDVWFAGVDKPFIVSWDAVEAALAARGLRLLEHFDRDEKALPFNPRKEKPYSDDWDEVAVFRVDRAQEVDVPDPVKWMKLTERIARPASTTADDPAAGRAGAEAGEAAELAARAASERAEAKKKKSRAATLAAVLFVSSGIVVPGVVILARRANRGR